MRRNVQGSKGPWLWPLLVTAIGLVLLASNFLLLEGFNVLNLWPLLLIIVGVQILLRGDILPSEDSRTFGITRGSVESGMLEINAGEIDVSLRALRGDNQERLIAGQYAHQSRPNLKVDGFHAHLRLERNQTPQLTFADWELGIARDLPWQLRVSTNLGQIHCDLSELVIQDAKLATGVGDIYVVTPPEAFDALIIHSTLGNIHIVTPQGYHSVISINGGRFFGINVDENRYQRTEDGTYITNATPENDSIVYLTVSGHFGNVYLA